jgi:hypothetical protein
MMWFLYHDRLGRSVAETTHQSPLVRSTPRLGPAQRSPERIDVVPRPAPSNISHGGVKHFIMVATSETAKQPFRRFREASLKGLAVNIRT